MASIARPSDLSTRPGEAFELVLSRVGSVGSEQTVAWLGHLLPKLGRFLENGRSISDVGFVDMADVAAWVNAPLAGGHLLRWLPDTIVVLLQNWDSGSCASWGWWVMTLRRI
jgi:hypothetical protein